MRAPAPVADHGAAPAAWRADVLEACLSLAAAHGLAGLTAALLLALGA